MSALVLSLILLGGCGKIECQNYYNKNQEYLVHNRSTVPNGTVQQGLDLWIPAGYLFRVGDPQPGQFFIRVESMSPEQSRLLWGQSIAVDAIAWLADGAGPDVVAHEFGHLLGISAHMDELTNPGCHVMNGSPCGATALTSQDYQLLDQFSCN